MGYIKKLKNNELVGGTDKHTIYPVTSTEAVFEEITEGNESSFKSQKTINGEHDDRIKGLENEMPDTVKSITINGGTEHTVDESGNVDLTIYTVNPDDPDVPAMVDLVEKNRDDIADIKEEIGTDTTQNTLSGRITELETLVGGNEQGSVNQRIEDAVNALYVPAATIADSTGHVSITLGETNGKIDSLAVSTDDIASAADLAVLTSGIEGLKGPNVVITSNHLNVSNPQENTIYREQGENTTYKDWSYADGTWYSMATYDIGNLDPQVSYYTCATPAATPAKTATGTDASAYALTLGGHFKVEMDEANTATSGVTLQVGNAAAKELMYNGATVDANNTWEAGEVIAVYYYNNKYWASNAQGGGGKADKIKYNNSQSGLAADNVQGALDETNDKITTRLLRVNFSVTVNVAVIQDGTYITRKANGWCVTEPLTFSKGDVIILTATGAPTSALLSKVVVDKSTYIPILRFTQSNVEEVVKYVVEEDGQYAACAHRDHIKIEITQFGTDNAKRVHYENIRTGLEAEDVQWAIDEIYLDSNARLHQLENIASNNEIFHKITYDDLPDGRCRTHQNNTYYGIIGRTTTVSFLEKSSTYRQASYNEQVQKGQQFIVHNAYVERNSYGYCIINNNIMVESYPQWRGNDSIVPGLYDIIITCKTSGTIHINIAEDGYILKVDENVKIKDKSEYETVDCELCTHAITVSDDAYGTNFWTTGMIDNNGIMYISYQCGAANSGSSGEGNLGGMSHFSITKPWISEFEITPHDTVIDGIAMNSPRGYMIKEITDDVIVRHMNGSIGEHGGVCNWNKTQSTCVKNTITYDGKTVDFNLYNISQMLIDKGILEGSANGDFPWDFTRQVKSDGYYWTMERSISSNNICPVILKSLDCVTWEYVTAIPSITDTLSEGGIAVKDGVMYACWRNQSTRKTSYFIYDINNDELLLDKTDINGTMLSRPSAFLYQENVYFVVNEISSIYNFAERRLQVAIYKVMPDYTLDRVYTLADANGINYHDIIVHGSYDSVYIRPSTYPHYATDQSVYMVYTSDRRHITQGGRKLSDIQLVNITPCLQPKYAGMQRYVNWDKANC